MKILQIINNLGLGGAERLIEELVPLMNNTEGIEVDILLLNDKNNVFDKKIRSQGIKIKTINLKTIYNPFNIFRIIKHIKTGNYDIVHSHLFPAQYWLGLSRKLINKDTKLVTTEHSTHNRRRDKLYFRYLDKYIYSQYDSIVSITDKVQINLLKWLNPKDKEVVKHIVIENGIILEKYINAKPYGKSELNSGFTESSKLVCMVSRFGEQKDQETAIRAMVTLSENIHLLLIGEGALKSKSIELVNKLNLGNRVHFLGFRNDIERILKTVDIVLLSSKWEGLSLSSIEGMAAEKPFIASRVEGLVELVEGYGLLFKQGDSEELAEIIDRLINDEEFYFKISSLCFKRAKEYDIKNMLDKTLSLYKRIMGDEL